MPSKRHRPQKRIIRKKNRLPFIALITDFGLSDQYVSVVKGVILSINPEARFIDITHDIGPQKIRQAGYILWSAYKYFPEGTVFVGIVDPGVGGKRRIIGVRTKLHTFLAPDNGLLDYILNKENVIEEIEINEKDSGKYLPGSISDTFHGRDVLATIAAHISKGIPINRLGVSLIPKEIISPFVHSKIAAVTPCILHIDHFGNVITNLELGERETVASEIQAVSLDRHIVSRWIQFYDEAPDNTPCLIIGSSGLVEVSVKNGNAARLLNITLDTSVKVYWR